MLFWRDLGTGPVERPAAEQAPLNSGARAGGRRLSAAQKL
jgi:hypothetical protein